ncbi:MAG: hypothetical protein DF168_00685 [Candidatus Moanabacter tarae]|uniref:Polymerase/histidinol phosphatase N-terminal domain-containing protein n=1 Tax=Candidatus Moanibacter tarae TaxID=2200854 RepID=A0A2Z4ADM7_9BACT|nr:MAG: hypothetical protein DF168_00685 [Candidatus Moanabacter tarae]
MKRIVKRETARQIDSLKVVFEGVRDYVATERETKPLRLYVECTEGLISGSDIRVVISTFHSLTPDWLFEGVSIEDGEGKLVLGHGLPVAWHEKVQGGVAPAGGGLVGRPLGEIFLCTVQVTRTVSSGSRLVFLFHANSCNHADVEGSLQVKVRTPESYDFELVGASLLLKNHPGKASRLEARITATPDKEGNHRLVVFATDDNLNPISDFQGDLTINSNNPVSSLPSAIVTGNDGRAVVEGIKVDGAKPVRITVKEQKSGMKAKTGPVSTSLGTNRKHFFGAMHFHTRLSVDGDRDPRAAYAYARDYLNLDVVAMTDHAPIGPAWDECLATNEEFYEPGRFVTIPAWESSNAYGHANIYLRAPDSEGGTWLWNPDVCPSDVSFPDDVVVVPHHPNTGELIEQGTHRKLLSKGIFWSKYDWSIRNPRVGLVEIVQQRGNFEADSLDDYWGINMGGQRASVQDALIRGWRLGFVAGTDNHQGYPTQGRDGQYVGMTCYRASELTRDAIWCALDQRRTYATSGVPIVCDFSVNGNPSGGEGYLSEGSPVFFSASIHGTASIERVEIMSMGKLVWQLKPNTIDVEIDEEELPALKTDWAYYYLRLRQEDGHRAWLSPVWLERR